MKGLLFILICLSLASCGTMHKIINNETVKHDTAIGIHLKQEKTVSEKLDTVLKTKGDTIQSNSPAPKNISFHDSIENNSLKVVVNIDSTGAHIKAIAKPQTVSAEISKTETITTDSSIKKSGSDSVKKKSEVKTVTRFQWWIIVLIALALIAGIYFTIKNKIL